MLLVSFAYIFFAANICFAIKRIAVFYASIFCNIHRIIDKAHTLICSFVLKVIAVCSAILLYKSNYFWRRVGYLDTIRLDMRCYEPARLYLMLEVYHEQRTALCNDVVNIAWITERVIKLRSCESVNRIDSDFKCLCKVIGGRFVFQIFRKNSSQHGPRLVELLMLYRNASVQNILETRCVFITEQILRYHA